MNQCDKTQRLEVAIDAVRGMLDGDAEKMALLYREQKIYSDGYSAFTSLATAVRLLLTVAHDHPTTKQDDLNASLADQLRYADVRYVSSRRMSEIAGESDAIRLEDYCPPLTAYKGECFAKLGNLTSCAVRYCVRPD